MGWDVEEMKHRITYGGIEQCNDTDSGNYGEYFATFQLNGISCRTEYYKSRRDLLDATMKLQGYDISKENREETVQMWKGILR